MPTDPPKEKHDHQTLSFPKDFLWGTATSSHQVEGGNINSDWWEWEQKRPAQYRSGTTCDEYHLYPEDFKLAQSLSINAHRLSIEWARIEPMEGFFNQDAIDHYVDVLQALKTQQFSVMLTLWHFTLPKWLADKGGWEHPKASFYFERFVEKILPDISRFVDFWITLNEPNVYVLLSYLEGLWPPQKKDKWSAFKVLWHLSDGHKKVYQLLHNNLKNPKVGISQNIQSFETFHKHSIKEQVAVVTADLLSNHSFYFLTKNYHDFLGVNYYFHHRFDHNEQGVVPELVTAKSQARDVSDMGWEINPEGIFNVLADLSDHIPIYITECGIATTNDDRRARFLLSYLQEVYRAIHSGIDIKGFFYWSLLDNFEWHLGFEPRFGLIEVDYSTQKRTPRPSAYIYAEIIRNNGIPHYLMRFLGHTVKTAEVLCYLHDSPKSLCEHLPS